MGFRTIFIIIFVIIDTSPVFLSNWMKFLEFKKKIIIFVLKYYFKVGEMAQAI